MGLQRGPQRLIYCVDGTWCGPDGARPLHTGTITNIYQICVSIHDSSRTDELVDGFFQKPVYMHGIGSADDTHSLSRWQAGVFGEGYLSQIQEIYEECCKLGPEDEVWLFGFSRGAFVVRAVAGLLHYMQALSSAGTSQFKEDYKKSLKIFQSMQRNGELGKGQMHSHFFAATKPPPKIKFVGALDTVKAVKEDYLFDISFNDSIQHMRHALALNEDREAMTPEYIFPETNDLKAIRGRSLVQAWFVGAHIDIGGSGSHAGLSLYPLQWLLFESQSLGLKLSFAGTFGQRAIIDNPLDLVFPSTDERGQGGAMWSCKMENEIEVTMQDIRRVHILKTYNGRYAIKLHKHLLTIWPKQSRIAFDNDGILNGWISFLRQGTIIHPSVYLHLDVSSNIGLDTNQTELRLHLEKWRKKTLGLQNNVLNQGFWSDDGTQVDEKLEAVRILVCGNCGVGKSTLINKVFGVSVTEVSERFRGVHNVREEIKFDTRPDLILHDSGGFEAGTAEEVNAVTEFLREKLNAGDIGKQLHMIWFCIESRSHKMQRATEDVFKAVTRFAHEVPIIVVATKKDEFLSMKIGECMRKSALGSMEECNMNAESKLEERINQIVEDISRVEKGRLDACVAVSEDDPASIEELTSTTSQCISIEKIRRIYISAQVARVDFKIGLAIGDTMRIYKQAVKAATAVAGVPFAPTSTRVGAAINLCKHIVGCFGLPTIRANLALEIVKTNIWNNMGNSLRIAVAELFATAGLFATVITLGHPFFLVPSATNIPLVVPATARLILMLSADLILILAGSFKVASQRNVGQPLDKDLKAAACAYLPFAKEVHMRIKTLFQRGDVRACYRIDKIRIELEKVIEDYSSKVVREIATKRTGDFTEYGDESRASSDSSLGK